MSRFKFKIKLMFFIVIFTNISTLSSFQINEFKKKIKNNKVPQWVTNQIKDDLKPFKNGFRHEALNFIMRNYTYNKVLIKIENNKITIFETGQLNNVDKHRVNVFYDLLSSISQIVKLPNTNFILSTADGYSGETANYPAPIYAFSKIKTDHVILIPDVDSLTVGQDYLKEIELGRKRIPWFKKISKAFWRGVTTGGHYTLQNYQQQNRYILVNLSKTNPQLIDARFTQLVQMDESLKSFLQKQGILSANVSIAEHLIYKYQLLIDGNTSSWGRAYWQLWSNCLIFKQESPHLQWYYSQLQPYKHYIPIKNNLSDLLEKLNWAKSHDGQARQIAENANKFARSHLQLSDMLQYIYVALTEYSKLLK